MGRAASACEPEFPCRTSDDQYAKDDIRAVLAGTTPNNASFPGPLIKGNKVRRSYQQASVFLTFRHQGDHFRINVNNLLTDKKMETSTSIVCTAPRQTDNTVIFIIVSIGTGSFNTVLVGQTVPPT
jgi:hypothetical protein